MIYATLQILYILKLKNNHFDFKIFKIFGLRDKKILKKKKKKEISSKMNYY